MKHVRESLSSFLDYKFFNSLNEAEDEEKEEKEETEKEEKPEKEDSDDKPKVDNKNDKKEQGELRDKEKDGLAVIDKLKSNFEKFKEDADGEIIKYKEFWEENKKAKEAFGEGDVYKMFDSDYVVAVLELPAETLSDGSIDGGLGATDEPEEEIIEGPELAPMTQGNELTEAEEDDLDLDIDLDAPEEGNPLPADGGQGDQMDLDTDTQGAPAEVPGEMPMDDMPPPPDMQEPEMSQGPEMQGGEEPNLAMPQVYFVVYDDSGDEREEILRTGSNNVVNAFKEFYNDTFKSAMKNIILKYKEAKEQQKVEAEKSEKQKVEKEKGSKISKFLGESENLNETLDDDFSDYEWEVGKYVSKLIPNYAELDLGDEVGDALYDFGDVLKKYMKAGIQPSGVARLLLADPEFLEKLGLDLDLMPVNID